MRRSMSSSRQILSLGRTKVPQHVLWKLDLSFGRKGKVYGHDS